MSGVPYQAFTTTVRDTGPTVLTGLRFIVNDSQKNNYNTLGYLMRGQPMSAMQKGGITLVDEIYLSAIRKARTYRPGAPQSYANPQPGIQAQASWRMFITDITWDETERALNEGAGAEGDRSLQLKEVWFEKQMLSYSDQMDFFEEQYWQTPDTSRMEVASGDLMYSFPALINEHGFGTTAVGLPPASYPGGAWTTKLGINPNSATGGFANWAPQQFQYNDVFTGTSITQLSFLTKLKNAFTKLDFRPPPMSQEYFEGAAARPGGFICCTSKGKDFVWRQYMQSQNRWDDQMDPYGSPMFNGAPFVYIAAKDAAPIYPTGTGAGTAAVPATEDTHLATPDVAGPRFEIIQPDYLKHYWHNKFTMYNLGVMDDRSQPTSHTMPLLTWCQLWPKSLRRHGMVFPSTNAATAAVASGGLNGAY